jgi:hypothetical protein
MPASRDSWVRFLRLKRQKDSENCSIGPLLTLSINPRTIAINTTSAATELLERAAFSCRPQWQMAKLLGRQNNLGFSPYGPSLRAARKLLHADLNLGSVREHRELLDDVSRILLKSFQEHPETCYESVNRAAQSLIVRFTYGHEPDGDYLRLAHQVMLETGAALQPGRWAVDRLPLRTLFCPFVVMQYSVSRARIGS